MGMLYGFLIVLEVLISFLLIVIIFMQKSKGGMGGSAFGGGAGEAIFGSRMGNVLTKATVVLGCAFLVNTLMLTVLTARRTTDSRSVMDRVGQPAAPQAAPSPMVMPEQQAFDGQEAMPFSMPDVVVDELPGQESVPALDDGLLLTDDEDDVLSVVEEPVVSDRDAPESSSTPEAATEE